MADKMVTAGDGSTGSKKLPAGPKTASAAKTPSVRSSSSGIYGDMSQSVVGVRDYTASRGYGNMVDWDGKNVTVAGTAIKPDYIENGTAYAPRTKVESAIRDMEKRNNIKGSDEIMSAYEKKYGGLLDSAVDALLGTEGFSYNPEDDPAYRAYREQYMQQGEAAYRRVLNDNDASVHSASGAVLSEALASRDSYLRQLAAMIPTLEQNAYKRYSAENDRLRGNLSDLKELADSYYDRLYRADRDAAEAVNDAYAAESLAKQRRTENERTDEQNRITNERNAANDAYQHALDSLEMAKKNIELKYYPDLMYEQVRGTREDNDRAAAENAMNNAKERGFFMRSDEGALPWLSGFRNKDGSYSVTPWLAQAKQEYDTAHAKALAQFRGKAGV
ncbi:MAG: hypothetical protein PUD92_05375 [Clostridiales bacterium]|nr:hypothetical protein [Clostridiales bacterium]